MGIRRLLTVPGSLNIPNVQLDSGTTPSIDIDDETGKVYIGGTIVSGTPGGINTQVQFNDGGVLAGNSQLTFNKITGVLNLGDDSTVNTRFSIKPNLNTDTENLERGLFIQTDSFGASGAGSVNIQGIEISSNHGGSGLLDNSWALEISDFSNYGGGTVDNSFGIGVGNQGGVGVASSTGITIDGQTGTGLNSTGLHVAVVSGATSNFAIQIDDQGASASSWAIKVDGGQNDLGPQNTKVGNLIINSISTSDPGVHGQLYSVAGVVHISA